MRINKTFVMPRIALPSQSQYTYKKPFEPGNAEFYEPKMNLISIFIHALEFMCAAHLLPSHRNQQVAISYSEWRVRCTHTLPNVSETHSHRTNTHSHCVPSLPSTHCSTNSIDLFGRAVSALNAMRVPIHARKAKSVVYNVHGIGGPMRVWNMENGNHAVASIDLLCGKLYNRFPGEMIMFTENW